MGPAHRYVSITRPTANISSRLGNWTKPRGNATSTSLFATIGSSSNLLAWTTRTTSSPGGKLNHPVDLAAITDSANLPQPQHSSIYRRHPRQPPQPARDPSNRALRAPLPIQFPQKGAGLNSRRNGCQNPECCLSLGERGEKEIEHESIGRLGKRGGSYTALADRLRVEYTLVENFRSRSVYPLPFTTSPV
jgi:hypothetical protein